MPEIKKKTSEVGIPKIYHEKQNKKEFTQTQQNQSSSALSSLDPSACTQCGQGLQDGYVSADSGSCEPCILQQLVVAIIDTLC